MSDMWKTYFHISTWKKCTLNIFSRTVLTFSDTFDLSEEEIGLAKLLVPSQVNIPTRYIEYPNITTVRSKLVQANFFN